MNFNNPDIKKAFGIMVEYAEAIDSDEPDFFNNYCYDHWSEIVWARKIIGGDRFIELINAYLKGYKKTLKN